MTQRANTLRRRVGPRLGPRNPNSLGLVVHFRPLRGQGATLKRDRAHWNLDSFNRDQEMEFRRGEDKRCTVNALSVPALGELFEAGLESAV